MAMKHAVYDTDTHFSINPTTRALKNQSTTKTNVIQYDHNSERFTFELPRYIEEHDMSLCDIIQVHYLNIDAQTKAQSKGVYDVTDLQISPEDDSVLVCSWLIPSKATQYVGSLNFLLRFCCIAEDGDYFAYIWNTAIYTGISVSNGIYNGDIATEEFPEVLKQWERELQANMIASVEQTQETAIDGGLNVWTLTMGDGRAFDFKVRNGHTGDVTIIQQPPLFANSIEECTDTSRLYVLPDGYIYHYKDTTIVHPATRDEKNITIYNNRLWGVSNNKATILSNDWSYGMCATEMIDLEGIPRPCYINLTGIRWGNPSSDLSSGGVMDANWVEYGGPQSTLGPLAPVNNDYYRIVNNNKTYDDVTITVKSDAVYQMAFTGSYRDVYGGIGSYDTAKAVLYYNVTEETEERIQGWYSTGHTFSSGFHVLTEADKTEIVQRVISELETQ